MHHDRALSGPIVHPLVEAVEPQRIAVTPYIRLVGHEQSKTGLMRFGRVGKRGRDVGAAPPAMGDDLRKAARAWSGRRPETFLRRGFRVIDDGQRPRTFDRTRLHRARRGAERKLERRFRCCRSSRGTRQWLMPKNAPPRWLGGRASITRSGGINRSRRHQSGSHNDTDDRHSKHVG